MIEENVDVLIIGAGLSGIGAASHLTRECPGKSFVILEGRDAIGGTWDLFRYPGIRSDSDMFTLGYNFKPWTGKKGIADGDSIREYICETADEHNVKDKIRFGHQVTRLSWSTQESMWTLEVDDKNTQEKKIFKSNFIISCAGYYNYKAGYEPEFKGRDRFQGTVIHPQLWPKDFDYSDKRVVVIGSGATAVTLVPAMTDKAKHVTMLQRSPSYVIAVPQADTLLRKMREYLPEKWVYRLVRTRNVLFSMAFYRFCLAFPDKARKFLMSGVEKEIGPNVDMKHFSPAYNPWDERVCAVPDGDMFTAIKRGDASVVTDHIETFTEQGIKLKSGEELEADIIITATGLDLQMFGGMQIIVDGETFDTSKKMGYRGVMLEGLPNMGAIFGYTNASWTLKADLVTKYLCRLLKYMDREGVRQCTPKNVDALVKPEAVIKMQSGYIKRAEGKVPKQGSKHPWKLYQNYAFDMATLKFTKINDGVLEFSNSSESIADENIDSNAVTG